MKVLSVPNPKVLNVSLLILRLVVGILLFTAGAGKIFGWFGGFGTAMTLQYYADLGIAPFWAYLSMYAELIGGLLLLIGFLTRPVAIVVAINMLVATIYSFPMGLAAIVPLIFFLVVSFIAWKGAGKYSVDTLIVALHRRQNIV